MISLPYLLLLGILQGIQAPTQTPTQPTAAQTPTTPVPSQDAFLLTYTPVEGATMTYSLGGDMQISGTDTKMESKILQKILKVDPDGTYSVQSNTLEGVVDIAGEHLQMPKSSTVTVYKPTGEVVSVTGDQVDQTVLRSENLTMLKRPDKPVKPGDTWSLQIKADPATKSPSVQGSFTFDGEELVGTYHTFKIRSNVAEGDTPNPGTVTATFHINKADGSLVEEEINYSNMTFPGGTAPLSGTLHMLRVDK